jgi:hypothetical protein
LQPGIGRNEKWQSAIAAVLLSSQRRQSRLQSRHTVMALFKAFPKADLHQPSPWLRHSQLFPPFAATVNAVTG